MTMQGPRPADFDDVQTTSARAVTIACCAIVALTMVLRTLGRYALKLRNDDEHGGAGHYLGLDDVFNFFAVMTFYGLAIAVLIAIDRGMGQHVDRVIWLHGLDGLDQYSLVCHSAMELNAESNEITNIQQAIYVCALTYNTTLGMVKLSVLALYRRILQGVPSRTLLILNWCVFGLVACNTTINVFIAAFQCNPVHAAFDSKIKGKCINTSAFYLGNAITGIITDTMVYLLSIPIVRPLQMDNRRKIVILITLLVGLFAVVTSCIRLAFLPALLVNPDTTWAMAVPMDWSVVEPTVGILVSSMPAIRSMIYLFNPKYGRSQNSSSYKSQLESNGQIKLHDFNPNGNMATNITTRKVGVVEDGDSEKSLIYQGARVGISKTTEVVITRD